MSDYEKMYTTLFNAMTDAIERLQKAQQDAEEQYMSAKPPPTKILPFRIPPAPEQDDQNPTTDS